MNFWFSFSYANDLDQTYLYDNNDVIPSIGVHAYSKDSVDGIIFQDGWALANDGFTTTYDQRVTMKWTIQAGGNNPYGIPSDYGVILVTDK